MVSIDGFLLTQAQFVLSRLSVPGENYFRRLFLVDKWAGKVPRLESSRSLTMEVGIPAFSPSDCLG
jgi:hypothetical protein